jgi:hypothetical protein
MLANTAPSKLPSHVAPHGRTSVSMEVGIYGSIGGRLTAVTVNGRPVNARTGVDAGHPAVLVPVTVRSGQQVTVVVHGVEPAWPGTLQVRPQPMVVPMTTTVEDVPCS